MTGVKVEENSLFFWKILALAKLVVIALAGQKSSIESDHIDLRQLGNLNMVSILQDCAARMLGF